MTKIDSVRQFLASGEHDLAAIRTATGLGTKILSVYLIGLIRSGEIRKSGTRGKYKYSKKEECTPSAPTI